MQLLWDKSTKPKICGFEKGFARISKKWTAAKKVKIGLCYFANALEKGSAYYLIMSIHHKL